jgi:hypothetical protein
MSLTTFKNRKWQRQRNDNDAYLEDLNQIVDQVNALPGTSTVLGYFATLAALTAAHPAGANGQFAVVGNTIYIWDPITSAWITIGDSLYKGVLDASTDIPYPTAQVGEFWFISVAGHIGSKQVEVGDQVICIEAYAGGMDDTKFMIVQTNIEVTAVSYSELALLLNNSLLIPGRHYLLHDFATAYNLFDGGTNTVVENAVGTPEALMLLATNSNEIAREAYSITRPEDIIYYHPYAKAVDRAAFIAAGDVGYIDGGDVVPNFKGVIEFRHDTKQNVSTWYDFRNVKFRRWAVDAVAYNGATAYVANDVCKSGVDGKIYKCITATTGEGDPTVNTADWILWLDIVSDAYVSWTSDKTMFNISNITTNNLIFVPATYQDVYTFGSWYNHVKDVTIGHNNLTLLIDTGYNTTLNNIVFKTTDDLYTCYSNEIGEISYNNTIGNAFSSNTIGNDFYSNTIGNKFSYNTIENGFNFNSIGKEFSYNSIGNGFNFNSIGNEFSDNSIGKGFFFNTIGNQFQSNTIGGGFITNVIRKRFSSNVIGNEFATNVIGESFSSNVIRDAFSGNTIGNNFNYNTIGNTSKVSAGINCKGNSIGDYNTQVTLGDNCTGISIGEKNGAITLGATNTDISIGNGNSVTTGAGCNGVTIHNDNGVVLGTNANGVFFGDGNAVSGSNNTIVAFNVGDRNTLVLNDGLIGIQIGNNNAITLAASCQRLTFKNGITFTTNTNASALLDTTFENGVSVTGIDFAAATHIKAAYNTTVFNNATPAAKLSYFDASNALTVDNVNA